MLMAATILGALHERNRTGQGRRLQLAMQDAMIHYMRTCFCTMARTGKPAPRNGAKSGGGNNAPSGLYPAKGGGANDYVYLTTSRANPEHWSRLMKLIGREELIEDPRFATGDLARQERKRARCDHRPMDPPARQARGDGEADRGRRAVRRGVRHDGTAERADP